MQIPSLSWAVEASMGSGSQCQPSPGRKWVTFSLVTKGCLFLKSDPDLHRREFQQYETESQTPQILYTNRTMAENKVKEAPWVSLRMTKVSKGQAAQWRNSSRRGAGLTQAPGFQNLKGPGEQMTQALPKSRQENHNHHQMVSTRSRHLGLFWIIEGLDMYCIIRGSKQ